jgi:hypothetical protein
MKCTADRGNSTTLRRTYTIVRVRCLKGTSMYRPLHPERATLHGA